jgi:hypothetical protein
MSSQQYGQAAPPSNMMFPTAAYLQASQNAAEMQMRGQEALGKGIAGGINAVSSAFKEHKEEQAKFDATKKLFKAFSGSLDEDTKNSIESIFSDTSISTKEKNAISPAIMQYLGNVQQQKGREKIAEIMHPTSQQPRPTSFGNVPTVDQIFSTPVGQPQAGGNNSDLPRNPSQGNPAALMQGQPASRMTPDGRMEVWSSRLNKYVEIDNPMQDIQY